MIAQIERLSVAERIQLVEDIWDGIAEAPASLLLTDAQRGELDQRLDAQANSPKEGISWTELKAKILQKNS